MGPFHVGGLTDLGKGNPPVVAPVVICGACYSECNTKTGRGNPPMVAPVVGHQAGRHRGTSATVETGGWAARPRTGSTSLENKEGIEGRHKQRLRPSDVARTGDKVETGLEIDPIIDTVAIG